MKLYDGTYLLKRKDRNDEIEFEIEKDKILEAVFFTPKMAKNADLKEVKNWADYDDDDDDNREYDVIPLVLKGKIINCPKSIEILYDFLSCWLDKELIQRPAFEVIYKSKQKLLYKFPFIANYRKKHNDILKFADIVRRFLELEFELPINIGVLTRCFCNANCLNVIDIKILLATSLINVIMLLGFFDTNLKLPVMYQNAKWCLKEELLPQIYYPMGCDQLLVAFPFELYGPVYQSSFQ